MGQGARTRTTELNELCTWSCKFIALEPCSLTQTLRSRLLDLVGFDSGSTHPQASWKSRAVLYFVTSRSRCGYDDFSTSMNLPLNFFMVLSISICILQLTCQTGVYISEVSEMNGFSSIQQCFLDTLHTVLESELLTPSLSAWLFRRLSTL